MKRTIVVLLCLLCLLVLAACSAEPETVDVPVEVEVTRLVEVVVEAEPAEAPDLVPIFTTDIRTYSSTATGRDYTVYVTLPLSYDDETAAHSYPVLYITDGDYMTIPTATIAGGLAMEQVVPEVITVGIGYGGTFEVSGERRGEDMGFGGQESFLQFLQEELIPDIEANYRADPAARTLMGFSLGGDFSLYALFHAPDTFANIIAGSPDCIACSRDEGTYAEEHETLPVRLFVSEGGLETEISPRIERFVEALQASDYDGLVMEHAILDGETHMSAWPRTFTNSIKWIFAD
jgi:predicted alpha/beta superfamily hydrolase